MSYGNGGKGFIQAIIDTMDRATWEVASEDGYGNKLVRKSVFLLAPTD